LQRRLLSKTIFFNRKSLFAMSENEENPLQQATTTEENVLEEFINVNNSFVPAAYRVNCIITY
jgi:hypothetical protein